MPNQGDTPMRPTTRVLSLAFGLALVASLFSAAAVFGGGGPTNEFVVNSAGDHPDADPGDGECDSGGAGSRLPQVVLAGFPATICTLRAAIQEANNTPNGSEPDRITFNIEPENGDDCTIVIAVGTFDGSPLPAINDAVFVDGLSQPGTTEYTGPLCIQVDGQNLENPGGGFEVDAGPTTIQGLAITRFEWGILLTDYETQVIGGNVVAGNFIGTDGTGTVAMGNGTGVAAVTPDNVIGTLGLPNLISGNGIGVQLVGGSDNRVTGNWIGTAIDAFSPLPNQGGGIHITNARQTRIESNTVSFNGTAENGADGIWIENQASEEIVGTAGHTLRLNSFTGNAGLAIDLGPDGPNPNDEGDADIGPNNRQNAPVIESAIVTAGGEVVVAGTLSSTASTAFTIDLYTVAECDPSGFGEGDFQIGNRDVTTDEQGNAEFSITLTHAAFGEAFFSALATVGTNEGGDPGDTSEFSNCFGPAQGPASPAPTTAPTTPPTTAPTATPAPPTATPAPPPATPAPTPAPTPAGDGAPNTAASAQGAGPLVTSVTVLVMLGSLVALGALNVKSARSRDE